MTIDISLVFATFNRNEIVEKLLQELGDIKDECEVIVIDDGSFSPVYPTPPEVKVCRHQKNMGSPKSWNDGIEAATRKVVLTLPDDIHLKFGLDGLKELSEMAQDKVVGLKVVDKSSVAFNHRKLGKLIYWLSGQVFPMHDDKAGFADFVSGTMAFPRDIPIRFDENLKGNGFREETDFQLRARRAGYPVYYFPKLALEHDEIRRGGQSDREESNWENHRYFLRKNYHRTWRIKLGFYWIYATLRNLSQPQTTFPNPLEFYKGLLKFEIGWVSLFSILTILLIFR